MPIFGQPNCRNQVGRQARLEHKAASAHFQDGATRIFILLNGEENNFGGRVGLKHPFGCVDSVENGHGNVEHDNIGKQFGGSENGRFPVRYHTHDFAALGR